MDEFNRRIQNDPPKIKLCNGEEGTLIQQRYNGFVFVKICRHKELCHVDVIAEIQLSPQLFIEFNELKALGKLIENSN